MIGAETPSRFAAIKPVATINGCAFAVSLISSASAVVPSATKSLPITSDQREIDSAQSLISNQGVNMPGV